MPRLVRAALTAAFLLRLLPPAYAQPATANQCRDLIASALLLTDPPGMVAADGADGCRFASPRFGLSQRFGYRVTMLTEHGIPFDVPALPRQPTHARVEARGILFELHSGQARADWLNQQAQVPFDVVLDGSYDPLRHEVALAEASLEGAALGRTVLALSATGMDPNGRESDAGLRSLQLHLDSRRVLVAFLLPAVQSFLPEEDTGNAVARAKAQAQAAVRLYGPLAGASPEAVAAIVGFIADFPRPQHVFDLSVTASAPVRAAAVEQAWANPAEAASLAKTLTVTATYAGDPR